MGELTVDDWQIRSSMSHQQPSSHRPPSIPQREGSDHGGSDLAENANSAMKVSGFRSRMGTAGGLSSLPMGPMAHQTSSYGARTTSKPTAHRTISAHESKFFI
ncbi:hypothetical protein Nepgr_026839 [Nepenthes gracilis]|uniref:Uncharacterized protein n=1 Tax=Nepenthes gracilis TaxID=150966 RepID=A0AAD3TAG8_NEPGR|nr:hypothetical protein Nepgr_026839 [Nepenthes gracilis]